MRFSSGFIKMKRALISEFDGDVTQLGLLTFIMASVNWDETPTKYTKMGTTYDVKKGEYITTYSILQEYSGLSFRTLKSRLERLKKHGYIKLKSLKNCMLIALCIDKCQFTCNGDVTTNEEYKNIRNNKHIDKSICSAKPPKKSSHDSQEYDSEGTKNIFSISQNRKNIPPVGDNHSSSAMTPSDLMKLWNSHSGSLAKIKKMTKDRSAKCKLRLKENSDLEFWRTVIKNLAASDFAKNGSWATFDWIIKNETNPSKAFEGNYQNKNAGKGNKLSSYQIDQNIPY